jgi:2-polyprenyl-3-methyl-5-hydroxy-6-metoxy-1,4-benzoquinol methylase
MGKVARHPARYDAWHESLAVDEGDSPWHDLVKAHLEPARDLDGRRLLEIGCGRGGFSIWLATRGERPAAVHAADFSPVAVAKGAERERALGVPALRWEVGDIQALAHRDATFDTVISCETVEHVPDPRRAIAELGRVLRPGGRLFLTAPNYLGTFGLYRAYLRLRGRRFTEAGQPINRFTTTPGLVRWVRAAGLRVTAIDGVGHYAHVPRRAPVRIHALDGARALTRWLALHAIVVAEKPGARS